MRGGGMGMGMGMGGGYGGKWNVWRQKISQKLYRKLDLLDNTWWIIGYDLNVLYSMILLPIRDAIIENLARGSINPNSTGLFF